jgi:hypothetical protein
MKIKILIITFLLNCGLITAVFSQVMPPAAMPSAANTKLIDQLVEVSGLQEYFIWYCEDAIDSVATKHKWKASKTAKVKQSINFDEFKSFAVYNAFAALTPEELNLQISFYKSLEKRAKNKDYCLWSYLLGYNIRSFAERYFD